MSRSLSNGSTLESYQKFAHQHLFSFAIFMLTILKFKKFKFF
jgi:hypothetical protein